MIIPFNPAPYDAHMRILSHLQPGSRVLDVGCSSGELGAQMKAQLGCCVVGVEIDPTVADLARKKLDEAICADIARLPEVYPRLGTFDAVVAVDVLEHLVNPWDVLRLLVDYLKPGGRVLISIPNVANYAVRIALLRGRFEYESNLVLSWWHLRFFTLSTLNKLVTEAGLRIDTVDCSSGLFLWPLYQATIERLFGRWHWYRHLEYLITHAWKTMFAFQFIVVARKQEGEA